MKALYDTIAAIIGNHFTNTGDCNILNSEIAITVFLSLYKRFILEGITKIEDLSQEEKLKYWNMVKGFCYSKQEEIIKSKAAYILSLITAQ
jgi:hypothetical protein